MICISNSKSPSQKQILRTELGIFFFKLSQMKWISNTTWTASWELYAAGLSCECVNIRKPLLRKYFTLAKFSFCDSCKQLAESQKEKKMGEGENKYIHIDSFTQKHWIKPKGGDIAITSLVPLPSCLQLSMHSPVTQRLKYSTAQ